MIEIINTEIFNEIVKNALAKSANYPRWTNAVNKAVTVITVQPEFITWLPDTQSIVIWNQESNGVHSANGTCDCTAYTKGMEMRGKPFPCFHRSMARIIRLYFEAIEAEKAEIREDFSNAPYFPQRLYKENTPRKIGKIWV